MKGPLISIITPNYNYQNYIGETVLSVVEQDYPYVEHIIVDDGSTDSSVEIIQSLAVQYPEKIRLITQENRGQTEALNRALENVRGDIIGWINSDDTYCPGVFKEVADFFQRHPEVDIVYGDFNVIDSEGRHMYRFKKPGYDRITASLVGFGVILTSNAIFWRREIGQRAGLFDPDYHYCMDDEYFSRLTRGATIRKINMPLANWRCHPQAKTVVYHREGTERCERERQSLFYRYYNELALSRLIPYKYVWLPRGTIRLKLIVSKIINGNYLIRFLDGISYKNRVRG